MLVSFTKKSAILGTALAGAMIAAPAMAQTTSPSAGAPMTQSAPGAATTQSTPGTAAPSTAAPAAPTSGTTFTDDQLDSFAMAMLDVDKISKETESQVASAPAEQKAKIQQDAQAKMGAAVQSRGLDPQTFNTIAQTAQNDPTLMKKVQDKMAQQMQSGAGAGAGAGASAGASAMTPPAGADATGSATGAAGATGMSDPTGMSGQ